MEARQLKDDAVEKFYYQMNDVTMLRLFGAFLGSAPQLVLQSYITMFDHQARLVLTVVSVVVALFTVSWAIGAYHYALRKAYMDPTSNPTITGLFLQTMWHLAHISCRVICMVAFAGVFKYWLLACIGCHWLLMVFWVLLQRTDFCPTVWEERGFSIVVGAIYCFTYFNVKEGHTRWRSCGYYLVVALENAGLLVAWYMCKEGPKTHVDLAVLVVCAGVFVTGLVLMCIYYCCCHPTQPKCFSKPEPIVIANVQSTPASSRPDAVTVDSACTGFTSLVPRRSFLKPQNSRPVVNLRQVLTPSDLSPIPSPNNDKLESKNSTPAGSTWTAGNSSMFQHFTINATAGFVTTYTVDSAEHSRVAYQQGNSSGMNFDCEKMLDMLDDAETASMDSENGSLIISLALCQESDIIDDNWNDLDSLTVCPDCGKNLPFIDQSCATALMQDVSVVYCSCAIRPAGDILEV